MKIVMVVNNELPVGLVANTAAVLGISLGKGMHDIVGPDIKDGSDITHKGITHISIPILSSDGDGLKSIHEKCIGNPDVDIIDFNRIAQSCKNYSEYTSKLRQTEAKDIAFSGLCLSGPKKIIDKLTGSLGLYR